MGSAGSGRLTARAAATARRLRTRASSDSPAPRPTVSSGERPRRAAATTAVVVVLPMPHLSGGQQLDPPVRQLLRRLQPRPQGGLSGGAVHRRDPWSCSGSPPP